MSLRRAGVGVLWYFVPALAVVAVSAYVVGAVAWHANPPVVPVAGVSMKPTLEPGDLIFLHGVDPRSLRKGDIIAFHVPKSTQSQYNLPGELVHRITKIQQSPTGLLFHTKGDANSGPDVVITPARDIVGKLAGRAPGLGYPLLFFRSRQGKIFLGATILIAIAYFLLGIYEERRTYAVGTAVGLQTVLAETAQLKEALAAATGPAARWGGSTDAISQEVRHLRDRDAGRDATIRELVGAIGEYGAHLRSHTAVMQSLAATTAELHRATAELGSTVAVPRPAATALGARAALTAAPRPLAVELPRLSLPVALLEQRMLLEARAARVDRLLERVSARHADTQTTQSPVS